jgi:hypothetical protein
MKKSVLTLGFLSVAGLVLAQLPAPSASAHDCHRRCFYNPAGIRVCRTVCHGHGHHPGHGHGDDDLAAMSSITALLFSTSAVENAEEKNVILVQATEDAAYFLETGNKTGLLPSLLQLTREDAAKRAGTEIAASLTDEEIVVSLLESAEKLLDK